MLPSADPAFEIRTKLEQIGKPLQIVFRQRNTPNNSRVRKVPWSTRFEDPIPLPRGRQLVTLKDAGSYITKLPKAEHDAPEWQAAMEALILIAENGGPTMLARIGVMRALNRHIERVFTNRKETHWGKRKLARDR